ncbi:hypothetical protein G8O18_14100 [Enterobacter kobei]|uniref:P27 family phage terminase small subunit n=1 Tax=Enterobacter kobei TaxID=208224 RepID=UPI002F34A503
MAAIPKKNLEFMLGELKENKEFKAQVQWTMQTLKDNFDVEVDMFTAINLVGLQKVIINCLNDLMIKGATYETEGDKGQDVLKRNPSAEVYSDYSRLLITTYREIGLTPKARIEFEKLRAEIDQVNSEIDQAVNNYLNGGLPE